MDGTLKYAEHKLDEAIRQGESDIDIAYWRGYRDCAKALEKDHFRDSTKMIHHFRDTTKMVKDLNELAEFYDYIPGRSEKFKKCASAITDLLARAEAAEAAQETLQRAMAEYKARAEKAEKCIEEIQSARDHTRPSYVVDEILRGFYDKKTFDELSKEAKKLYNDILTGESIKADT